MPLVARLCRDQCVGSQLTQVGAFASNAMLNAPAQGVRTTRQPTPTCRRAYPSSTSRKAARPKATMSPGWTTIPGPTRQPFARVPLVEPRSTRTHVQPTHRNSAWRRDTVASPTTRSQARARPIVKTVRSPRGSGRDGTREVCQAALSCTPSAEHQPTARNTRWGFCLGRGKSRTNPSSSSEARARSATSKRRTNDSCDSRPLTVHSRSTSITRSRSASDARGEGGTTSLAATH